MAGVDVVKKVEYRGVKYLVVWLPEYCMFGTVEEQYVKDGKYTKYFSIEEMLICEDCNLCIEMRNHLIDITFFAQENTICDVQAYLILDQNCTMEESSMILFGNECN